MSQSKMYCSELKHYSSNNQVEIKHQLLLPVVKCKSRKSKLFFYETNANVRSKIKVNLTKVLQKLMKEYNKHVHGEGGIVEISPKYASFLLGTVHLKKSLKSLLPSIVKNVQHAIETNAYLANPLDLSINMNLFTLPPLKINGVPISLNKMTQADLRSFIPLMMKFSLKRSKPGWGKPNLRPVWWPEDIPWANVRNDTRSPEEKANISWSYVLRKIVKSCYLYHGRGDLITQPCSSKKSLTLLEEDIPITNVEQSPVASETLPIAENEPTDDKSLIIVAPNSPVTYFCTSPISVTVIDENCIVLADDQQIIITDGSEEFLNLLFIDDQEPNTTDL